MKMWFSRLREPWCGQLVADCEAFLSGQLAERVEMQAVRVPVWAWTNLLAHGTEGDLRSECTTAHKRRNTLADEWRDARAYLAGEVLQLSDHQSSLSEMQHAVLVPLELDLASCVGTEGWGPCQWVASVEEALCRYRRTVRRDV
jgi:hypothetical protein